MIDGCKKHRLSGSCRAKDYLLFGAHETVCMTHTHERDALVHLTTALDHYLYPFNFASSRSLTPFLSFLSFFPYAAKMLDQGIAYALMIVALVVTYLIH